MMHRLEQAERARKESSWYIFRHNNRIERLCIEQSRTQSEWAHAVIFGVFDRHHKEEGKGL